MPARVASVASVAAMAAAALLTAGCGQDAPGAKEQATPAAGASNASGPSTTSSAEAAVLAWLRDPALGVELSDAMARCEAREIVGSDLPDAFLTRLADDDFTPTQDETDQLLSAVGQAEQTCVAELPDDPAAP